MWITKEDLNKQRISEQELERLYNLIDDSFEEPEIVEHKGITMVSGSYLRTLFENSNEVYTTFWKIGKKVHDVYGGVTGIGLEKPQYFKLAKKENRKAYESSVIVPFVKDDLSLVIEHYLEIFPKEIIDHFEQKVFLTCSLIPLDEYDYDNHPKNERPESLKEYECDSYVLIEMMSITEQ